MYIGTTIIRLSFYLQCKKARFLIVISQFEKKIIWNYYNFSYCGAQKRISREDWLVINFIRGKEANIREERLFYVYIYIYS